MKNPHIFPNFIYFFFLNFRTYVFSLKKPFDILIMEKNVKWPIYGNLVFLANFVSKIGPFKLQ